MRLGAIEIQPREVDAFTGATLLRAYQGSAEPARSLVLLSALALCCSGPPDWPTLRRGMDYAGHGALVRDYLGARKIDLRRALALGLMAVERIAREPGVTDEEAKEYADFFGLTSDGSDDSDSHIDTAETPSVG